MSCAMEHGPFAVIGGGAWGTALAVHLGRKGAPVRLWMRDAELVTRLIARRDNPTYLPGVRIPDLVTPFAELPGALQGAQLAVAAVPSPFARQVYRTMAPFLDRDIPLLVATKGIEEGTLRLPLEVAHAELGVRPLAVLSGPSFALEVAQGLPTALVVSSADTVLAARLQRVLASRVLRVYTNADTRGVQLSGALKNIMAIAIGVADSLGTGTNARAALITRGLAEMSRLVAALGGSPSTTAGLAGLGDLVLTCTGELSRNRRVGQRLGRGERLQDILSGSRSVAEGVRTASSARELAHRVGVDMPIVEEVCRILCDEGSPRQGLERLLGRPLTSEDPPIAVGAPEVEGADPRDP
jgi:glycerol-3-phosphate dehydrogenase (NAD(P)+)